MDCQAFSIDFFRIPYKKRAAAQFPCAAVFIPQIRPAAAAHAVPRFPAHPHPARRRGFSRPGAAARMRAEKHRQAANRLLCGRRLPVLFLFFESRIHFSACSASSQEQIESNVYESSRSRTSFEISL